MILPARWRIRCGAAARQPWNTPVRFTSMIDRQSSGEASASGVIRAMPALFTTMCRPPRTSTVRAMQLLTSAKLVTSVATTSARPPRRSISWAVSSSLGFDRAATATSPRASASAMAIARPRPPLAPVTTATRPASDGALGVERLQVRAVLLGHDLALDLERGRQLAALEGEVAGQHGELLDLGVGLQVRVLLLDRARHALDELGVLDQGGRIGVEEALLTRELRQLVGVERDQGHRIRSTVAVDHHLADERVGLQEILDVLRRDIHAAGGDDEVLLPVGDEQKAVLVDPSDVAAVEPSVGLEDLASRLRLLEIAASRDVG